MKVDLASLEEDAGANYALLQPVKLHLSHFANKTIIHSDAMLKLNNLGKTPLYYVEIEKKMIQ